MSVDKLKQQFGLRVQELRRQRGLTQEALADLIGKSTYTVSNIENGRLSTRIETASRLSEALGVALADLFEIQNAKPATDRDYRRAVDDVVRSLAKLQPRDVEKINKIIQLMLSLKGES